MKFTSCHLTAHVLGKSLHCSPVGLGQQYPPGLRHHHEQGHPCARDPVRCPARTGTTVMTTVSQAQVRGPALLLRHPALAGAAHSPRGGRRRTPKRGGPKISCNTKAAWRSSGALWTPGMRLRLPSPGRIRRPANSLLLPPQESRWPQESSPPPQTYLSIFPLSSAHSRCTFQGEAHQSQQGNTLH